jgi:transcription termination/antitermination protein NusA
MPQKQLDFAIADAIESIAKEKSLDTETVLSTIKEALLKAIKKRYGTDENIRINIDSEKGTVKVEALKKVVRSPENPALEISKTAAKEFEPNVAAGDEIWVVLPLVEFGRNAI